MSEENFVLILIVVEDGLVHSESKRSTTNKSSLNPYCSGRWSRTTSISLTQRLVMCVLILIVVEDGLVLNLIRLF